MGGCWLVAGWSLWGEPINYTFIYLFDFSFERTRMFFRLIRSRYLLYYRTSSKGNNNSSVEVDLVSLRSNWISGYGETGGEPSNWSFQARKPLTNPFGTTRKFSEFVHKTSTRRPLVCPHYDEDGDVWSFHLVRVIRFDCGGGFDMLGTGHKMGKLISFQWNINNPITFQWNNPSCPVV